MPKSKSKGRSKLKIAAAQPKIAAAQPKRRRKSPKRAAAAKLRRRDAHGRFLKDAKRSAAPKVKGKRKGKKPKAKGKRKGSKTRRMNISARRTLVLPASSRHGFAGAYAPPPAPAYPIAFSGGVGGRVTRLGI